MEIAIGIYVQGLILNNAQGQRSINLALLTQPIRLELGLTFICFVSIIIATILFVYFSSYNMSCAEMTSKVGVAHKISRVLTRAVYLAPPHTQSWIRPCIVKLWR